jgi:hypothetical protein
LKTVSIFSLEGYIQEWLFKDRIDAARKLAERLGWLKEEEQNGKEEEGESNKSL